MIKNCLHITTREKTFTWILLFNVFTVEIMGSLFLNGNKLEADKEYNESELKFVITWP